MLSRVFEAIEDVGVAESPSLNVSSRRLQIDIGDTARSRNHKPRHFSFFVRYKQFFYCGSHCGTTLTSKDVYSVGGDAHTSFHGLRGRLKFCTVSPNNCGRPLHPTTAHDLSALTPKIYGQKFVETSV